MIATLPHDLRVLRDCAILLIGYVGGLRRSEIVGLDHNRDDTPDGGGWIEIGDDGAIRFLRGKTGWREVEIGRGTSVQTCPVHALEQWRHLARIDYGPLFRRTTRDNIRALDARRSDNHVARLSAASCQKRIASPCSRATVCVRVWPRALTSMSDTFKSNWVMHPLK